MKNENITESNFIVGQHYCHDCCSHHPEDRGFFKLVTADYQTEAGINLCTTHAKARGFKVSALAPIAFHNELARHDFSASSKKEIS